MQFIGVRPGEKLFEELFYGEASRSEVHPKVFQATLESEEESILNRKLDQLEHALTLPRAARGPALIQGLCDLVPSYRPSETGAGRWVPKSPQPTTASA
jgi:FlaA1/EpsC-like NDP-sugar epimerase